MDSLEELRELKGLVQQVLVSVQQMASDTRAIADSMALAAQASINPNQACGRFNPTTSVAGFDPFVMCAVDAATGESFPQHFQTLSGLTGCFSDGSRDDVVVEPDVDAVSGDGEYDEYENGGDGNNEDDDDDEYYENEDEDGEEGEDGEENDYNLERDREGVNVNEPTNEAAALTTTATASDETPATTTTTSNTRISAETVAEIQTFVDQLDSEGVVYAALYGNLSVSDVISNITRNPEKLPASVGYVAIDGKDQAAMLTAIALWRMGYKVCMLKSSCPTSVCIDLPDMDTSAEFEDWLTDTRDELLGKQNSNSSRTQYILTNKLDIDTTCYIANGKLFSQRKGKDAKLPLAIVLKIEASPSQSKLLVAVANALAVHKARAVWLNDALMELTEELKDGKPSLPVGSGLEKLPMAPQKEVRTCSTDDFPRLYTHISSTFGVELTKSKWLFLKLGLIKNTLQKMDLANGGHPVFIFNTIVNKKPANFVRLVVKTPVSTSFFCPVVSSLAIDIATCLENATRGHVKSVFHTTIPTRSTPIICIFVPEGKSSEFIPKEMKQFDQKVQFGAKDISVIYRGEASTHAVLSAGILDPAERLRETFKFDMDVAGDNEYFYAANDV